jgi:hypothetical protein
MPTARSESRSWSAYGHSSRAGASHYSEQRRLAQRAAVPVSFLCASTVGQGQSSSAAGDRKPGQLVALGGEVQVDLLIGLAALDQRRDPPAARHRHGLELRGDGHHRETAVTTEPTGT